MRIFSEELFEDNSIKYKKISKMIVEDFIKISLIFRAFSLIIVEMEFFIITRFGTALEKRVFLKK